MNHRILLSLALAFAAGAAQAYTLPTDSAAHATHHDNDSTGIGGDVTDLKEVSIIQHIGFRRHAGAENAFTIGQKEMFRAACCNLGESFQTNPSVDVAYTDAATGAKQIKLLGLSGTYVQMLAETLPAFRGSALPYALGYVPGTWMKGIQVSKGTASVKNGYESVTGQINIDYLKPEDEPHAHFNLFGDTKTRVEFNADANFHLNDKLSTVVMGHFDKTFEEHDENDDGFYDRARARQLNLMNRWKYVSDSYIFHGGVSGLHEKRQGGQMEHAGMGTDAHPRYQIDIEADRVDAFMKHAFVLNPENGTNIAIMTSGAFQSLDALYGHKAYGVDERNAYASLMFETNFHSVHNLSTGLSLQHDYLSQRLRLTDGRVPLGREKETVAGAYAQYTYQPSTHLTAMAGLRIDDSSLYGTFLTPRAHLKVQPADFITLRLSAGKGFRTTHALAQYNNLLASGRQLAIDDHLDQEEAWNYGASANFYIPLFGKTLKLNAEYNFTDFRHQTVVDYDSDPERILVTNLNGDSRSHVFQVDASYPFFTGFNLTAAWRWNDVKTTYGGQLRDQILTSKYKGLITASYETAMRKWQFDVTLQLNGSGRLPDGYPTGLSHTSGNRYKAFEQLSAQVTREFRHFSVYVGGENLTGVRQKQSILNASTPWTSAFEPTLVWGPVHGAMAYAGIRITL